MCLFQCSVVRVSLCCCCLNAPRALKSLQPHCFKRWLTWAWYEIWILSTLCVYLFLFYSICVILSYYNNNYNYNISPIMPVMGLHIVKIGIQIAHTIICYHHHRSKTELLVVAHHSKDIGFCTYSHPSGNVTSIVLTFCNTTFTYRMLLSACCYLHSCNCIMTSKKKQKKNRKDKVEKTYLTVLWYTSIFRSFQSSGIQSVLESTSRPFWSKDRL